jgi:hypothetical protein
MLIKYRSSSVASVSNFSNRVHERNFGHGSRQKND